MAKQKSQLARAFAEDGAVKTHVGGQALIEGVMMRGKLNWAAAVREPDGNIYVEEHDLASGKEKNRWLRLPLVRGCTALVESRRPPMTGRCGRLRASMAKAPLLLAPAQLTSSLRGRSRGSAISATPTR